MTEEKGKSKRKARPGRKLNVGRIKSIIVFLAGVLTAFGSALTGLAPQTAFAPMLTWMLGFQADKAQASALRFASFATLAAAAGAFVTGEINVRLLVSGLCAFLGATIGAVLAAPVALKLRTANARRFFQILGVGLCVFLISDAMHRSFFNQHRVEAASPFIFVSIGLLSGALTQITALSGGALMVPGLYYLGHLSAGQSIALSLVVVFLASLLPAWSYTRKGGVDTVYASPAITGGILGSFLGGVLLVQIQERWLLATFAVIAMFFCARELSKLYFASPSSNEM